jgi:hypothetical protein
MIGSHFSLFLPSHLPFSFIINVLALKERLILQLAMDNKQLANSKRWRVAETGVVPKFRGSCLLSNGNGEWATDKIPQFEGSPEKEDSEIGETLPIAYCQLPIVFWTSPIADYQLPIA